MNPMQLQNSSSKLSEPSTQTYIQVDPQKMEPSPVEAIAAWLVDKLSQQLSLKVETIDLHQPFTRYGLDSIDAVTLVGDLEDLLGLELPSTLFWDYPTIEKSAQYLVQEFNIQPELLSSVLQK